MLDATAPSHVKALKSLKSASELPQLFHRPVTSPRRRKRRPKLFSRLRAKSRRYFSNASMNQNSQAKSQTSFRTVLSRLKHDLVRVATPTVAGLTTNSSMWWAKTFLKKKTR